MKAEFLRLDELLAKDGAAFTAADSADLERLAPLPVDPAYQEYQSAVIESSLIEQKH